MQHLRCFLCCCLVRCPVVPTIHFSWGPLPCVGLVRTQRLSGLHVPDPGVRWGVGRLHGQRRRFLRNAGDGDYGERVCDQAVLFFIHISRFPSCNTQANRGCVIRISRFSFTLVGFLCITTRVMETTVREKRACDSHYCCCAFLSHGSRFPLYFVSYSSDAHHGERGCVVQRSFHVNGLCETQVGRCGDVQKPLLFCPGFYWCTYVKILVLL